jgi:hypothetical protein
MAQVSKSAYATRSHLLVEFGLLVLHFVLEEDLSRDPKMSVMPNPLVPIVNDSLHSQHGKIRRHVPTNDEYQPLAIFSWSRWLLGVSAAYCGCRFHPWRKMRPK